MAVPRQAPEEFRFGGFLMRHWQRRDRDAAAALIGAVLSEYGLAFDPEEADRDVLDVQAHYFDRAGEFWVVERDGELVGTAAFFPLSGHADTAEIRKMYLHPSTRGRGLGRRLLQLLEERCAARGFRRARLETASVLKEAVELYRTAGYLPSTDAIATRRCDLVLEKFL
jgi:putative acetyltransferase